jgi:hypothetical protein
VVVEGFVEIAAGAVVVVVVVAKLSNGKRKKKRRKQKATTTSIFIQEAALLASFCCHQRWCVLRGAVADRHMQTQTPVARPVVVIVIVAGGRARGEHKQGTKVGKTNGRPRLHVLHVHLGPRYHKGGVRVGVDR